MQARFLNIMRAFLATTCILASTLLFGGCATKKYVQNTTAPIQAKVDQVGQQTTQNGQQIEDTRNQLKQVDDKATTGISAATEKATSADQHAATADQHATAADQHAATADQHAGDAMNKANQVGNGLNGLKNVVANIDDYKMQTNASIQFGLAKYVLSSDAKGELDKFADTVKTSKRLQITVEGFTDSTGAREYNEMLSRKRADAVVEYLVAKHDIPVYQIHVIGLGDAKPVDDAKTRAARAKNRRVEVTAFSADGVTASLTNSGNN
jgi:OmpA-OmpF porin, OOP family